MTHWNSLIKAVNASLALLSLTMLATGAGAGTWGQENWGEMYWGSNPVSPPAVAPTVESIVADGTDLLVTISDYAPGEDGWSGITGYTVTCGASGSVSSVSSPIRVEGLEGDTDYECIVTATNAQGESEPSLQLATTGSPLSGLNITIIYSALCRSQNPPPVCN